MGMDWVTDENTKARIGETRSMAAELLQEPCHWIHADLPSATNTSILRTSRRVIAMPAGIVRTRLVGLGTLDACGFNRFLRGGESLEK
jgi:ADP-ribosylglycohydrolase